MTETWECPKCGKVFVAETKTALASVTKRHKTKFGMFKKRMKK